MRLPRMKVRAQDGELCSVCEFAIQTLEGYLKENSTEAEIEAALQQVCDVLPSTIKDECDALVKDYTPTLVQLLLSYQPQYVCQLLGLCSNSTLPAVEVQTPVLSVRKENADLCSICEFLVEELDHFIGENTTVQEVESFLNELCELLPGSAVTECESLVKQYTPFIVALLAAEVKPDAVCKALSLCPNMTTDYPAVPKQSYLPDYHIQKQKTIVCSVCYWAVEEVKDTLDQNNTEAEIMSALEKICDMVASGDKSSCMKLIPMYTNYIIQLLEDQVSPGLVCDYLKFCDNASGVKDVQAVVEIQSQVAVKKNELCPICILVLNEVDAQLDSNATKEDAIALLDKVCQDLPSAIEKQCEPFVQLYLPYVIDLVVQKLNPEQICAVLKLCTSQVINTKALTMQSSPQVGGNALATKSLGDSQLCELCVYIFQYIDNELTDNVTEAEVEKIVSFVCSMMPSSIKKECDSLINLWTDEIMSMIAGEIHPNDICVSISMCSTQVSSHKKFGVQRAEKLGDGCEICQTVLSVLDGILGDNATQKEIVNALTLVCDIVPRSIKADCNKYIAQYFNEVVELLLDFPPSEICSLLNLCPSKAKSALHSSKAMQCDLCEMLISQLESMISSTPTEDEIESALEKVCGLLPSTLRTKCDALVETYTPTLISLLLQETRPRQVCIELRLCSNTQASVKTRLSVVKKQYAAVVKNEECELCTAIMTELQSILSDKSTQEEIRNVLDFICSRILPSALSESCSGWVNTYEPIILEYISGGIAPKDMCILLEVCQPSNDKTVSVSTRNEKAEGGPCTLCELAIEKLESLIPDKPTEAEVEAALKKVCNILPSSLESECKKFMDEFGDLIVQLIFDEFSAKEICSRLGLCLAKDKMFTPKLGEVNGLECDLCKMAMKQLESMISSKPTEAEVRSALEKICSYLPQYLEDKCDSFVDEYSAAIIDLIVKDVPPAEICQQLGLCSSHAQVFTPKQGEVNGLECDLCKMAMKQLESMISSKPTEAEVRSALEKICSYLPQSFKDKCTFFVDEYSAAIIDLIVKDVPPAEICQQLGLCSSHAQVAPVDVKGASCVMCEIVMEKLKSMISSKSTEAEVKSALEKVCSILPEAVKEECDSFVDTYSDIIIHLILNDVTPEKICEALGLCPSSALTIAMGKGQKASIEGCTLCEFALEEIKGLLQKRSTVMEMTASIEFVCRHLPTKLVSPCLDLAIMYGPNLVEYLDSKIAPKRFCQLLYLCDQPKHTVEPSSLTPSKSLLFKSESGPSTPSPDPMPDCSSCKFALYEVQTAFESPYWRAEAPVVLNLLCKRIKQWPDVCMYMVEKNLPSLIQQTRAFRFPIEFCQDLKLCEAPKKTSSMSPMQLPARKACRVCNSVVQQLTNPALGEQNELEMKDSLSTTCSSLVAKSLRGHCVSLVQDYAPVLKDLLVQHKDPLKVCKTVGLCQRMPLQPNEKRFNGIHN